MRSRSFVRNAILGSILLSALLPVSATTKKLPDVNKKPQFLKMVLDETAPGFTNFSFDSLGRGEFTANALRVGASKQTYRVVREKQGNAYYQGNAAAAAWQIIVQERSILLRSKFTPGQPTDGIVLEFDPSLVHPTLLGRFSPSGDVRIPAILHLPGMGSMRITSDDPTAALAYHAHRNTGAYVSVAIPAADETHPDRSYRLEVVLLAPALNSKQKDLDLDAFHREYLDGMQLQAELHVLANNSSSDPCAFTLYEAADIALFAPPLADNLRALDLVRDTLDRYIAGFKGYGQPGFHMFDAAVDPSDKQPYTYSDTYPSLLISAYDYVSGTGDTAWLKANYAALQAWQAEMMQNASAETGLTRYPASGNSGSWTQKITVRPANWWDTIGFGHEDAWGNALAYRALRSMAALAARMHDGAGQVKYSHAAALLKANYASTFLNPKTGLLAGWKSADGRLHDYSFLFVNGAAVRYGLLDPAIERAVVKRMLAEITRTGYTRFDLGLPGNLIPIRREDYVDLDPRFGGPLKEDGSDGFQVYENGGATAAFAYFTIAALYHTHHEAEADRIFMPMLKAFAKQGFSGKGTNGMSKDWKDWQGGAHGYEGFLADNYYALLCVLEREHRGPIVP